MPNNCRKNMKTFTKTLALSLIMIAACLVARAEEKSYLIINYMRVPDGQKVEDYLALEKLWQRLHQKAVDTGFCKGWFLHRIEGGSANRFVTVEIFDSLDKYAQRWPSSIREGLYNSAELEEMRQTGKRRDLIRSEIWEVETAANLKPENGNPAKLVVDYMKPKKGKVGAYFQMEETFYKKIHQARINAGKMQSWVLFSRLAPGGTEAEYNAITFNGYSDKAGDWDGKFVQTALTKEELEALPNSSDLRTIVNEEVWIPVAHVMPAKK
jgi:hypothetical protein